MPTSRDRLMVNFLRLYGSHCDAKHEYLFSVLGIFQTDHLQNNQPNDFYGSRVPTLKEFTKGFYRYRKPTFL